MEKVYTLSISTPAARLLEKTRCKNEKSRQAFESIYFSAGFVYATNGRLAVKIADSEYSAAPPDGPYEIISTKKENQNFTTLIIGPAGLEYPNILYIFQPLKSEGQQLLLELDKKGTGLSAAMYKIYRASKMAVLYDYLLVFAAYGLNWNAWPQYISRKAAAPEAPPIKEPASLYIKSLDGSAEGIILPFNMN